jgi:hypothetical protein
MANSKISALPAASTPLAGTELVPVVQGGITEQVSVANLTAGRAVAAQKLTLSYTSASVDAITMANSAAGGKTWYSGVGTGSGAGDYGFYNATDVVVSLVLKAAGDVSVNTGNLVIGTSGKGIDFSAAGGDVLTIYDEGTWTPTFTNCGVASASVAKYTRIGRCVSIQMVMTGTAIVANSSRFTLPIASSCITSGTFTVGTLSGGFVEAQASTLCYFATTSAGSITLNVNLTYSV